jgi:putative methyltransferase (TIGR04325 family)
MICQLQSDPRFQFSAAILFRDWPQRAKHLPRCGHIIIMVMKNNDFCIWEGIYDHFPQDYTNSVFESKRWVNALRKQSLQLLDEHEDSGTISDHTLIHEHPLPPVVALLATWEDIPIRVLDFGGGMGNSFFSLVKSLPNADLVEFHVIETTAVCKLGHEVYKKFHNLHFHDELPIDDNKFDIVHAGNSLHYIADWRTMLEKYACYEPHFIMLSGLNAGDIETFVTYQNYYGSKIPVWFWNIREILEALRNLDYSLIYKSLLASSYLGKIQSLPMVNFPPQYRLKRKCNLIFRSNIHYDTE